MEGDSPEEFIEFITHESDSGEGEVVDADSDEMNSGDEADEEGSVVDYVFNPGSESSRSGSDNGGVRLPIDWTPRELSRWEDYHHHQYKYQPKKRPEKIVEEYIPNGRWIRFTDALDEDWYHLNGIPQEVSLPGHRIYLCFRKWMMWIARTWHREFQPNINLNPELFGGIYDRIQINFFRVMKARISIQRAHSFWVRTAAIRIQRALVVSPHPRQQTPDRTRYGLIMFSLMGLDPATGNSFTEPAEVESLRLFIRRIALIPWREFLQDYLRHHPDSSNPRWNIIQPTLSNPNVVSALNVAYGHGAPPDMFRLNKDNWNLEDHACRFILTLYSGGWWDMQNSGIDASDATYWRRYFFSTTSSPETDDRYWFGFAMLMLLMNSWQHQQQRPLPEYDEMLVPALYEGYPAAPANFPQTEVGLIDLSPFTPWNHEIYQSRFNFTASNVLGLTNVDDRYELIETESETELMDDGSLPPDNLPKT